MALLSEWGAKMNFENLNKMIEYIENNLTEKINYNALARIIGVSEYNLQRIFMFITNISLSEYIRKRRLSNALEELKTSNIKIIDLAVKYQYDSSISFSRSFKKMFGVTPNECRKNQIEYDMFPVINFVNNSNLCKKISYQIKYLEEFEIYCIGTFSDNMNELCIKINNLYNKIRDNGLWTFFNKNDMYGVSIDKDNLTYYYVGSRKKHNKTEKVVVPSGYYFVFEVGSRNQKDILKTENIIYNQWNNSTNMSLDETFIFELYTKDNCYLYALKKR